MSTMLSLLVALLWFPFISTSSSHENTQETTLLWTLISTSQNMQLHGFIIEHPSVLMLRSEDGRGAIWWAWEYKNAEALAILAVNGVDLHYSQTDNNGEKPYELCDSYDQTLKEAQSLIDIKKIEKEQIKEQIEEEKRKMFLAEQEGDDFDDEDDDDVEEDDDDFTSSSDTDDEDEDEDFFHDDL